MYGDLEPISTGNSVIDDLRGLQMVVDQMDDPDLKIRRVRQGIELMPAFDLLEKQFYVTTAQTFTKHPNAPSSDRQLFTQEFILVGTLASFGYMLDQDVPVDSLVLNFKDSEVLGVNSHDSQVFRILTFQIPILAIEACIEAA